MEKRDLGAEIEVDSCGTGDWHIGHSPDVRATAEAKKRGYELSSLKARQVSVNDFELFDYVLAMDNLNLADLRAMRPSTYGGHLELFLPYAPDTRISEVPDPYYGGDDGFSQVLDLIESASEGLLQEICSANTER